MALLVQKFGGTSLGSFERIRAVAKQIKQSIEQGQQVVVVVSAMSGQTNSLYNLAYSLTDQPSRSELDAIIATGEQVSAALVAVALSDIGCPAKSFGAAQLDMRGDDRYGYARLLDLSADKILSALDSNIVPVVTGFQAVGSAGQWLTLGRGGSDTTAVVLAAKLQAKECQIFTDVRGVYTADPRVVQDARLLDRMSLCALSYMASSGAKVIQRRAIECAYRHKVVLRILSSFEPGAGTLVDKEVSMESCTVTGIAFEREQLFVRITISGEKFISSLEALLAYFARTGVHLDCLRQDYSQEQVCCSFLLPTSLKSELDSAISCCQGDSINVELRAQAGTARLAIVGIGIGTRPEVAAKILSVLSSNGIAVQHILTDEHRYTLLLAGDAVELAAKNLHEELIAKQPVIEQKL